MHGIVIKTTGSWYLVQSDNENVLKCRIKGKLRLADFKTTNPVAIGDIVDFEIEREQDPLEQRGIIVAIHERKNYIIRKATNLSKQSHILAANIDHAYLIITIKQPRTSVGFIDRFLITAEAYNIPVSLIINKIDLLKEADNKALTALKSIYTKIGYAIHEISVLENYGLESLKLQLKSKISLFAGHSGVGKSSLINALDPTLTLKTGMLSSAHQKGIHTTTNAELFELKEQMRIIDIPGIKELGVVDVQKEDLAHFFPEMKALINQCKYNSCLHLSEPGCKVKEHVSIGLIAESRYASYTTLMNGEELIKKYPK